MSAAPPPRFGHGEQVTILITAAADAEYEVLWGAREVPVVSVELPGRPAARVDITYDRPGVDLIHGDIRPTLIRPCVTPALSLGWRVRRPGAHSLG